jgi:starch synthase
MKRESRVSEPLHVLFIAAEADPLVKAGGLGDVAGSLPVALSKLRDAHVDVRVAIPFYNSIRRKNRRFDKVGDFELRLLDGMVGGEIFSTSVSGVTFYLISGEPISRLEETYSADFKSDADKFIFFSLACLQLPVILNWRCEILHAHDWHTAVAIHQLKSDHHPPAYLESTRTVLTVHNLSFMGTGSEEALASYNIKPSHNKNLPIWARTLPLPMGLASADRVVAVSPTYAREIMTPEFGCDLQGFLQTRQSRISGILNGIDIQSWDPATDAAISTNFDAELLDARLKNKRAMLKEFQLDFDEYTPLLILISRLDRQKGIDIALEGLRMISDYPWHAILLGTGDKRLEQDCKTLEADMPDRVRAAITFDSALSRRMYAGADILMMPSRYEPCGLSQMFAMRYGCIPVARATGGLVDTITDPKTGSTANGFLFPRIDPRSFAQSMRRAIDAFAVKDTWRALQINAMAQDFSWQKSAQEYLRLYHNLIDSNKRGENEPAA